MQVDVFNVFIWFVEAWLLIVVVKWGVKLLLAALGVKPRELLRRLRMKKRLRGKNETTWSS